MTAKLPPKSEGWTNSEHLESPHNDDGKPGDKSCFLAVAEMIGQLGFGGSAGLVVVMGAISIGRAIAEQPIQESGVSLVMLGIGGSLLFRGWLTLVEKMQAKIDAT